MEKIIYKSSKLSREDIEDLLEHIKQDKIKQLKKDISALDKENVKTLKQHLNNLLIKDDEDEDEDEDIVQAKQHIKQQHLKQLKEKYKEVEQNREYKNNLFKQHLNKELERGLKSLKK